jgi:excisionase family DNA binding protein
MKNEQDLSDSYVDAQARMNKLLKVKEVAKILGVKPGTVARWLRSGALPALKLSNSGGWRVRSSDLEAWLERPTRTRGA